MEERLQAGLVFQSGVVNVKPAVVIVVFSSDVVLSVVQ